MPASFNHGGTYKRPEWMYVNIDGTWTAVEKFFLRHGGSWQTHYHNEITVTLTSRSSALYLDTLFTAAQWASPKRKRVIVPAGVEIGTASNFAIAISAAASQATSWAGDLILDVFGIVSGIGGAANSGNGGDVILANVLGRAAQKLIINLYGTLRAGGGGGGRAGNGGAGRYTSSYIHREPASGFRYAPTPGAGSFPNQYGWFVNTSTGNLIRLCWNWGPQAPYYGENATGLNVSGTSYTLNGWTYLRGTNAHNDPRYFSVSRQQTRTEQLDTAGGVAGNAGRGQGFNGAATAGAAAVAGGTSAGASGKSGNGGAWGEPGQAGANGANGNVGNGTAGSPAGLAGAYLNGAVRAILNNFGTVRGRLI